ncbi:hypothetical protein HYC85_025984 [Camellia sinensis]|uniref:Retinoblastoma-related protein n=1 Tax=Camellia sinensis TaxID=4442 RepID=A0A7J7G3F6_CAMSI|nr:hypothetical protein HYC85_025984 [Camellia sinensis]
MSPPALDMEDHPLKTSIPTADASLSNHGRGGPSLDARFAYFCKTGLALNENTYTEAMKLFSESKHLLSTTISAIGTGTPEEAERYCIVDFFKELHQFIVKAGPILSNQYGTDWEKRLEVLILEELSSSLEFYDDTRYYKRAFREFFLTSDAKVGEQSTAAIASGYVSDYHRFGWLLFLALRTHAFSRFKDLVTCTNGLVAILAILIIHIPVRVRNFNLHDSPRADGLIYFEDLLDDTSLPSSLNILEKDYADATRNKGELDERVFVNEEDSLLGSGSLSGGAMNISGAKRKIDSIASPARTITSPLAPYCSPSASHAKAIPCGSNSKMAATPVTTAMTTAKWLRTIISPLPPKPSPELERFLSSCDSDVTTDVIRRANIILEAIFPSSGLGEECITGGLQCTSLMDSIWAEQRRLEALKLYYRVLQAMCTAEAQILHANNLTSLLTNERFHRCMLACSAELVLATHKTATMLFPAVLERTGITAFDLSKMIGSFIRHEESLPRELKRHLNSLEERLLESMVWEKGSSMYNSLTVARPALSAETNRLCLLAEPMPSLDAIAMHMNITCGSLPCLPSLQKNEISLGQNGDIQSPKRLCTEYRSVLVERNSFTSPVKDRLLTFNTPKSKLPPPALQSAFASPTRPNPGAGGETCAETAINVFFSKVLPPLPSWVLGIGINGMVERLQLSQEIREIIFRLFQQILSQRTTLFFNRHIDQIILCCFYGVAKISQLSLTFKEIIFNYRKQPQCKPQVFRSVFVDWSSARRHGKTGQEHVDIITFYNEIFIPAVKPLLVELAPVGTAQKNRNSETINGTDGQCPGSPKISPFPSLPDMSPKKMDALISNGSKSYYACVGESTHAYQSPSKDLTAINNRLNGNRKLRGTLNFDEVDVGLVSDTLVANSLCLQNGSCASSSGAPVKSERLDS